MPRAKAFLSGLVGGLPFCFSKAAFHSAEFYEKVWIRMREKKWERSRDRHRGKEREVEVERGREGETERDNYMRVWEKMNKINV